MRRFEASLRRATPKGQDPSSPAQHRIKDPSYIGPSLRSGHTSAPTGAVTTSLMPVASAGKQTGSPEHARQFADATD
jgi:hypothetical protein